MTETVTAYDAEGNKIGIAFYDPRYHKWGTRPVGKPQTRPEWDDAEQAVQWMREGK